MPAGERVRSAIADARGGPLPASWARVYLDQPVALAGLLLANAVAFLVGLQYYAASFDAHHFLTWWLFADSPAALAVGTVALATRIDRAGDGLDRQMGRLAAMVHTNAVVALVYTGIWTAIVVGWGFPTYEPTAGLFLIVTHLGFVVEAALLAHVGSTDRLALATATVFMGVSLGFDYLLGNHPPIPYAAGQVPLIGAVLVAPLALGVAWWWLPPRTQAV
ncbi:MAG: DUF1405 domain-containing protein [Halococcoides sp.]